MSKNAMTAERDITDIPTDELIEIGARLEDLGWEADSSILSMIHTEINTRAV